MFHPPTKGPGLGVQPVGGMCSNAVRVGAGELALLMSDPKGCLVGSANGLAWHPNPCGFAILQDLKELRVPCGAARCSISPLGAWFLVDDMVTHLPGWDSWIKQGVGILQGFQMCHHSTSQVVPLDVLDDFQVGLSEFTQFAPRFHHNGTLTKTSLLKKILSLFVLPKWQHVKFNVSVSQCV